MQTANWAALLEIRTPASELGLAGEVMGGPEPLGQLAGSPPPFLISSGEDCDIDINECDSNPCHHAGTCLDQPNGYTCHCPHGWVGANCEIREYFCSSVTVICHYIFIQQEEDASGTQPVLVDEAVRPWGDLVSPAPPSPSRRLLLTALFSSHSLYESSLSTGMRRCRCHPEVTAAKRAKNVRS